MRRSDIRYALFRCRTGNPLPRHLEVYEQYKEELAKHSLNYTNFPTDWDVDLKDPSIIVSGIQLTPLKEKVEGSLFNDDDTLKVDDGDENIKGLDIKAKKGISKAIRIKEQPIDNEDGTPEEA